MEPLRVVLKRLVAVDLPNRGSHQHELNAPADLRAAFEGRPHRGTIVWLFYGDDPEPLRSEGEFNLYDARARSAARTGRTEWRFYYSGDFLARAQPGDVLFLVLGPARTLHGIVCAADSAWLRAAASVLPVPAHHRFELVRDRVLSDAQSDPLGRRVLEEIGVESVPPAPPEVDEIALEELEFAGREGRDFPSTLRMAQAARQGIEVRAGDWDGMLTAWLAREEALFAVVERLLVSERIAAGFSSVDDFATTALSVLNRRKARMGYSLQHHLSEVFRRARLRFEAQARTEGRNQPDFLFPGAPAYHDPSFDPARLVMLGAKATCKDRWRQILAEADRIPAKHLCTIDPAISEAQLAEMHHRHVVVVIPGAFQRPYRSIQTPARILGLADFVEDVRRLQAAD